MDYYDLETSEQTALRDASLEIVKKMGVARTKAKSQLYGLLGPATNSDEIDDRAEYHEYVEFVREGLRSRYGSMFDRVEGNSGPGIFIDARSELAFQSRV